jgi:hypothetical protein
MIRSTLTKTLHNTKVTRDTEYQQLELQLAFREYLKMLELRVERLCAGAALRTMLEFQHEVQLGWVQDEDDELLSDFLGEILTVNTMDAIVISGEVRPHFEIRQIGTFGLFKRPQRVPVGPRHFVVSVARHLETDLGASVVALELEFKLWDFQGLAEFELDSRDFVSSRDFLAAIMREPGFIRANGLPALQVSVSPSLPERRVQVQAPPWAQAQTHQQLERHKQPQLQIASSNV